MGASSRKVLFRDGFLLPACTFALGVEDLDSSVLDTVSIGVMNGAWDNLLFSHRLVREIVTAASSCTIFAINTHAYTACLLCCLIVTVAMSCFIFDLISRLWKVTNN